MLNRQPSISATIQDTINNGLEKGKGYWDVFHMRPIRLLHDEVLIRLINPERISHGLYIPDTAKRQAHELWRGEVLAVGPGARTPKKGIRILPEVQVGDKVLFYWLAGLVDVVKFPDEDHRIIHESQIQLLLERAA